MEIKVIGDYLKGFLRGIANEICNLVRSPANMTRFRNQIRIFCEKNEAHQRELKQLKKDYEADSNLQQVWHNIVDNSPIDNEGEPEVLRHLAVESVGILPEPYEGYVLHNEDFWGPPTTTADLWKFLTPPIQRTLYPPQLGYSSFLMSKQPDDDERLICYYALLTAIHDEYLMGEKPICPDQTYTRRRDQRLETYHFICWRQRNRWVEDLWCNFTSFPVWGEDLSEVLNDTRDWIKRALVDVEADLTKIEQTKTKQDIKSIKKSNKKQEMLRREADIAAILGKNHNVKQKEIAKELKCSVSTISRSQVWKRHRAKPQRNQFADHIPAKEP